MGKGWVYKDIVGKIIGVVFLEFGCQFGEIFYFYDLYIGFYVVEEDEFFIDVMGKKEQVFVLEVWCNVLVVFGWCFIYKMEIFCWYFF